MMNDLAPAEATGRKPEITEGVMRSKGVWLAIGVIVASTVSVQVAVRGQRGPKIRTLTEQEMVDMAQGSSIQASRSSNTETMVKQIHEVHDDAARGPSG